VNAQALAWNGRVESVPNFMPRKRYYAARHLYRFVRPGDVRVELASPHPDLRVLALASPDRKDWALVDLNTGAQALGLHVKVASCEASKPVHHHRTSERELRSAPGGDAVRNAAAFAVVARRSPARASSP
jgi:hypothetical protein